MTGSNNGAWPIADVDRLKDLWGRGWSAASIAEDMPRYTRNGIIGKIHRLKLTRAPTGAAVERRVRPGPVAAKPRVKAPIVEPMIEAPAPLNGLSLFDLTNTTCRWPIGIVGSPDFHFCGAGGADLIASRPYCREHTRMARKL